MSSSALHWAIASSNTNAIKPLLKSGASLEATNEEVRLDVSDNAASLMRQSALWDIAGWETVSGNFSQFQITSKDTAPNSAYTEIHDCQGTWEDCKFQSRWVKGTAT